MHDKILTVFGDVETQMYIKRYLQVKYLSPFVYTNSSFYVQSTTFLQYSLSLPESLILR